MNKHYYTTREAMDVLDVSKTGLLFMIKKYKIRTKRLEHWNRLMLLGSDVDALKDRPRRIRRTKSTGETTRITRWGYVERYAPRHPLANTSGYILDHRLVMEKKLGRPLRPNEVVHHIDGNKQNNTPSNLALFESRGQHLKYGHRLNDVWKKWCYRLEQSKAEPAILRKFVSELRKAIKIESSTPSIDGE